MKFVFQYIDPNNPEARFSFNVKVDETTGIYSSKYFLTISSLKRNCGRLYDLVSPQSARDGEPHLPQWPATSLLQVLDEGSTYSMTVQLHRNVKFRTTRAHNTNKHCFWHLAADFSPHLSVNTPRSFLR